MTVVLIGPPGAGKSRVGRRLAKRLGTAFTDTDSVIANEHGAIREIFARHGEAHFRALERDAVATALAAGGVVSLGGGAVLDQTTRSALAGHTVILLTVTPEAVAARIGGGKRPLVSGIDSWRALVAERTPVYESLADRTIDTSRRPVEKITEEIAAWVEENQA